MANEGNIFGAGNIDAIINLINTSVGLRSDIAAIPSDTTSVINILKKIYNTAVNIEGSLLALTETGGTVTTDGTVQILYVHDDPPGIYSPKIVQIDFSNQTAAEIVEITEYYRIKSAGAPILTDSVIFAGVQAEPLKTIILEENRYGVLIAIEKTAGANKDYDWMAAYKI